MKNCPVCNRVLVKKTDHSLTCIFCGWKGKGNTHELKMPENKPQVTDKKTETPVKIETNPENIAKHVLQQENSQLPHFVLAGAVLLTVIGFISNQLFQEKPKSPKSTRPVIEVSEAPVQMSIPSVVSPSPSPSLSPLPETSLSPTSINSSASPSSSASPDSSESPNPKPSESSHDSQNNSTMTLVSPPPLAESPDAEESPSTIITASP